MNSISAVVLGLLVFALAAPAVHTLQCWGKGDGADLPKSPCMSLTEGLDTSTCVKKTCEKDQVCKKTGSLAPSSTGEGCVVKKDTKCVDTILNKAKVGAVCHCDTELCNSGVTVAPKMFLAMFSILAVVVVRHV